MSVVSIVFFFLGKIGYINLPRKITTFLLILHGAINDICQFSYKKPEATYHSSRRLKDRVVTRI